MSPLESRDQLTAHLAELVEMATGVPQPQLPVRFEALSGPWIRPANDHVAVDDTIVGAPLAYLFDEKPASPISDRVAAAEARTALITLIRAQIRSASLQTEVTRPSGAQDVLERGIAPALAEDSVDLLIEAAGLAEARPLLTAVRSSEAATDFSTATVRGLAIRLSPLLGTTPMDLLRTMAAARRGDAMLLGLATQLANAEGFPSESAVTRDVVIPVLIGAMESPILESNRLSATLKMGAEIGELGRSTGIAAADAAVTAITELRLLTDPTHPAAEGPRPATTAAALMDRFQPHPLTAPAAPPAESLDVLLEASRNVTAQIIGGTGYVTSFEYSGELEKSYPHISGDYRMLKDGTSVIRLKNADVAAPLEQFLAGENTGSGPMGRAHLVAVANAARVVFHENIHSVGSADWEQAYGAWALDWPGARVVREGVTELTARLHLTAFMSATGLLSREPQLATVQVSDLYRAETGAMAALIAGAADRGGLDPRTLLTDMAAAGDADAASNLLAATLVTAAGIDATSDHGRLVAVPAVRRAFETHLAQLDFERADIAEAARLHAGVAAGDAGLKAASRVLSLISHSARSRQLTNTPTNTMAIAPPSRPLSGPPSSLAATLPGE